MNRHQSNPFLAGWEEAEADDPVNSIVLDMNSTIQDDGNQQTDRTLVRRSSSGAGQTAEPAVGNPFGEQRAADRRLYHRNMSSFEAASLQLEQQQQQQLQGANNNHDNNQTDLIAKMTADFQSAMQSSDKQFQLGDDEGQLNDGSAFDPFETIVDDDISIPSPANMNQAQQADDKFFKKEDTRSSMNGQDINEDCLGRASNTIDRPNTINLDSQSSQPITNAHDSIDDDEEDLVSTPVRNIKSSPLKINPNAKSYGNVEEGFQPDLTEESVAKDNSSLETEQDSKENVENTDSIAKASLFASLLASAESTGTKVMTAGEENDVDTGIRFVDGVAQDEIGMSNVENATHVIKGSPSTSDGGNVERPVSFFDPFETVIDKDAITSLMNESQRAQTEKQTIKDELDFAPPTKTPEPTPVHQPQAMQEVEVNNELVLTPNYKTQRIAESVSIETVIEKSTSTSAIAEQESKSIENVSKKAELAEADGSLVEQEKTKENLSSVEEDKQSAGISAAAGSRLTRSLVQESKISTPVKKPNKPKKKPSFQEDSSDSSEDDDRIQIVIKARNTAHAENRNETVIVPLLPPPPSKSSMKQSRERGQVEDMPSPVMSYKTRNEKKDPDTGAFTDKSDGFESSSVAQGQAALETSVERSAKEKDKRTLDDKDEHDLEADDNQASQAQFVIPMTHSDEEADAYGKPDTPLYDEDTSYVLEEFPTKYEGPGWEMMLRYPPKKKLTSNRFWKKIFVKLAQVPLAPEGKSKAAPAGANESPQTCIALQIYDKPDDKKPMQEIPIQATYTVSEISSQQFDQFGKIFTLKLQYIFYKERVGVRQGQLARFIYTGHIGSSTTSGGHGADPISIGAIKKLGAPIEHSPQVSQIIKLGCTSYSEIKQFKNCLEDYLFKMPITRDRALSTYKTEEVQMAVRDETYLELNQVGQIVKQLARVRLFFLSFLNGTPTVEVGINDIHRQGKEVVGRMDILPVVTEEWIRLEACELHSTVDKNDFENPEIQIIKLVPPDATFFELMRFRVRPPKNRELPLQISANMSVTRTKVSINCDVMVPGCVSRKHGQIPCEGIAIKIIIPECWIYFFREEKHFRMGSKKSVNRRPGKVKGIERFLGGGGLQDINDESSLIEVTSGQAKYEHHHHAIVWRAARWPKESQSAYVQNTMKIRLPLTAFDKMPDSFYEYVHVEYTMPATTVSHTTLRSISVNPCDDEPPEKYVKYSARYEYKVKMRLSINLGSKAGEQQPEASPIVIMKQPDLQGDLQREEDSNDDEDEDEGEKANVVEPDVSD